MIPETVSYVCLTASGPVKAGPVELHGFLVTADGTASYIDIHEGRGTSGKLFARIRAEANVSRCYNLTRPLILQGGLYIAFYDAHITHVTVIWNPI